MQHVDINALVNQLVVLATAVLAIVNAFKSASHRKDTAEDSTAKQSQLNDHASDIAELKASIPAHQVLIPSPSTPNAFIRANLTPSATNPPDGGKNTGG